MNDGEKRSLPAVIDRILAVVPQGEMSLRRRIKSIYESAAFSPPENHRQWWGVLCKSLEELLPQPPVEPWQDEVSAIVRGEK